MDDKTLLFRANKNLTKSSGDDTSVDKNPRYSGTDYSGTI